MNVAIKYIWQPDPDIVKFEELYLKQETDTYKIKLTDLPIKNSKELTKRELQTIDSDIVKRGFILKPIGIWSDPLEDDTPDKAHYLVLCEDGVSKDSYRDKLKKLLEKTNFYNPWVGIEQEYYLFPNEDTTSPSEQELFNIQTSEGVCQTVQKLLDNSTRKNNRRLLEHLCVYSKNELSSLDTQDDIVFACAKMGLKVNRVQAVKEQGPGHWEVQFGPTEPLQTLDETMIGRYIIWKIGNEELTVSFEPKPKGWSVEYDLWAGSGLHFNYSNDKTRAESVEDYLDIKKAEDNPSSIIEMDKEERINLIKKAPYTKALLKQLAKNHRKHVTEYGIGNEKRQDGDHGTTTGNVFVLSKEIDNKNVSVRIVTMGLNKRLLSDEDYYGLYLEDRRPSANANPYRVALRYFETVAEMQKNNEGKKTK